MSIEEAGEEPSFPSDGAPALGDALGRARREERLKGESERGVCLHQFRVEECEVGEPVVVDWQRAYGMGASQVGKEGAEERVVFDRVIAVEH
ncbi:MAG: hypothetical protein M3295_08655, partial [Chloroflexota bacterium]|nr:hypothetical protein [Chloroflexota bacterium]